MSSDQTLQTANTREQNVGGPGRNHGARNTSTFQWIANLLWQNTDIHTNTPILIFSRGEGIFVWRFAGPPQGSAIKAFFFDLGGPALCGHSF